MESKESQRAAEGAKGNLNVAKREPKGTKMEQKGCQMVPKGSLTDPKGVHKDKTEPQGCQKGAKVDYYRLSLLADLVLALPCLAKSRPKCIHKFIYKK